MLALKQIKTQYITNETGERTGVILSIEDFQNLMEDIEDLIAIAERKEEPITTHKELIKELKKDGLI